jgi:NAD(P)H-hydrate repair Nnr-like enzyme with NAD(P)H-hydrate epimerase domain
MTTIKIHLGNDFSRTPGGRYEKDWLHSSAEEFRNKFLIPPLQQGNHVTVVLDGVYGVSTGFLEEAFGGVIRKLGPNVKNLLDIVSNDSPSRAETAKNLMAEELKRQGCPDV